MSLALDQVRGGLTAWFGPKDLPGWKMVLTVLLGLFPTVMLITVAILPWLRSLPFPLALLVGNVLSVSMLQWVLMPRWNRWLGFWLQPTEQISPRDNLKGTVLIVGAIGAMLLFFWALGLRA